MIGTSLCSTNPDSASAPLCRQWGRALLWLAAALVLAAQAVDARAAITVRGASQNGIASIPDTTITHVGSGSSEDGNGCETINPSIPSGNPGDLLIAQVVNKETNGNVAINMDGWNTYYSDSYSGGGDDVEVQAYIFWRVATGSDPNDVEQTGGPCVEFGAQISRFSGVDTSDPFETQPGANFQDDDDLTTGEITTTTDNAMLLVGGFVSANFNVDSDGGWGTAYDFASGNNAGDEESFGLSLHYQGQSSAGDAQVFNWPFVEAGDDEQVEDDYPIFGVIYALTPASSVKPGLTIPTPSGTEADDVMLAAISVRPESVGINAPAGWSSLSETEQSNGNSNAQEIFYRVATGSEPGSYTWNFSGGIDGAAGGIISYDGVDVSQPIDVSGGNITPSGTQHTADSVTTTVSGTRLIATFSYSSARTWTPPGGMTEQVDVASEGTPSATGISLSMHDEPLAVAGATGTRTAQVGGDADTGVAYQIALRPDQTGPGGGACNRFEDSFEDQSLSPWQRTTGDANNAGVNNAFANDGSYSMFTRGGTVIVESPTVDLSGVTQARVNAWVRGDDRTLTFFFLQYPLDPDDNADLVLEYWSTGATWEDLARFPASAGPGATFTPDEILPSDALHSDFRLRFRQVDGDSSWLGPLDRWHIDSICVTAQTGPSDYAIDVGAGAASTCTPASVSVTVQDGSGDTLTDYTGNVQLSTSSGNGTWDVVNAAGVLTDNVADDGSASYEFVSDDNGSIELSLANPHADDLVISVTESDGSPSTGSGTLSFRDNAFVIESVDAFGSDFIAGRNHDLAVSLWRRDPSTGDCSVADGYDSATQDVKLWIDRHMNDPGGAAPEAAGQPLPDSSPGSNNATLDFSSSTLGQAGRAPLALSTSDVGRYSIQILDDTSGFAQDESGTPRPIAGGTGTDLVVRPFGLHVSVTSTPSNPAAQNAMGDAFIAAGTEFELTVTAVQYQSSDDDGEDGGTANDGVPDGHADSDPAQRANLADNAVTPSFGNEGSAQESVNVAAELWKPGGQNNPGLNGGSPLEVTGFAGGSAPQTTNWNEVGIIELAASLNSTGYLGSGRDVHGRSGPVGRFHPERLSVSTVNDALFLDEIGGRFTYMGQCFGFDEAGGHRPQVRIEALSADGSTVLDNYGGEGGGADSDFWMIAGTLSREYSDATTGVNADLDHPGLSATECPAGTVAWDIGAGDTRSNYDGSGTFEIRDDRFAYMRLDAAAANRQVPFDSSVNLKIPANALDDGDACFDPDDNGGCDPFQVDGDMATAGVQPIAGTELRFGRLVVESAGGAEIAPVELPVRAQYWSDNGWTNNTEDDETELTLDSEIDLTNELGPTSAISKEDGDASIGLADAPNGGTTKIVLNPGGTAMTLSDGVVVLPFEAPGAGKTGWAAAIPRLESEHPYLRYDWNTDGAQDNALDDDPRGRVTFGIYGGNDRWIDLRRVPVN